nr:polysaccharide lyase 8 family protein [uncultured Albidiferax sp.]
MNKHLKYCMLSAFFSCAISTSLPTTVNAQVVSEEAQPYSTMMGNALSSYITSRYSNATVKAGIDSFVVNLNFALGEYAGTADPTIWPWPNVLATYPISGDAVVETLRRARDLAISYRQPGSVNYGSTAVKNRVLDVLQWVYLYKYNTTTPSEKNWWNSEIGAPRALMECVLLMYPDLTSAQRSAYLSVIDFWVPDPTKRKNSTMRETGANLLDKSLIVTMSGVLGGNSTRIIQGRDAIQPVFDYVTRGDGFYEDGSFIQHSNIPYTGSYGAALLSSYAQIKRALRGTSYASSFPNEANAIAWIRNSYLPSLYQGASADNLRGRAIGRQKVSNNAGREILRDMLRLIDAVNPPDASQLRSEIKWHIQSDKRRANYFELMEPSAIGEFVGILSDSSVPAVQPAPKTYAWNSMARFFHRQNNYSFGVSLFSNTIRMYESINKENLKGWFTGLGMTTLLNGDASQYVNGYWATVDMARLPGITTPGSLPTATPGGSHLNTFPFTGGVALDGYGGVFGMRFSLENMPVDNSGAKQDLTGRKSWIAFPRGVVAIGSDLGTVRANNSSSTIVENRKISNAGLQMIAVGNSTYVPTSDWQLTAPTGTKSVLFADNAGNSNIGYYFPAGGDIRISRKSATGSWSSVDGDTQWLNPGVSGTALLSNDFFQISLVHAAGPELGSYAYMMLPGMSSSDLLTFANSPTISLIEGSSDIHAAYDSANKLLGANVWSKATNLIAFGGNKSVVVSDPASLFIRETASAFDVVITDPSANGTGSVVLTFNFNSSAISPAQVPGLTILQLSPLKISLARSAMKRTPIAFTINK